MNLLLSIIVPVYNVEKYLERCLDSILVQPFRNFELILVNDGSTDNSLSICKRYEATNNRIVIVDKPNGGLSSARNAGLKVAKVIMYHLSIVMISYLVIFMKLIWNFWNKTRILI